jgi:phospholipid transport system substrate-binding protein
MIRRWLLIGVLVSIVGVVGPAPRGLAQSDPVAFVNQLGTQFIQVLGPKVPAAQRLARFRELIAADFDIPGIGQFVLGRYWASATPQQQQQFLGLFREFMAQAYSNRLAEYAGEPFRAISARQNGGETIVSTEIIRPDGSKVQMDVYLINRGGYKATDAYVAGVSMRVTQRDEFASIIQQGGGQVSYLLDRLRAKVAGGG